MLNHGFLVLVATLLFSNLGQAQLVSPYDSAQMTPDQKALFDVTKKALMPRLQDKNVSIQSFYAFADDSKSCSPKHNTYIGLIRWMGTTSAAVYQVAHLICVPQNKTDISLETTATLIPGSYKEVPVVEQQLVMREFPSSNKDGLNTYKSNDRGDYNNTEILTACLPEGVEVYGWTSPAVATRSDKSHLVDYGTRDAAHKNCVNVKVHLEGNGLNKIGEVVLGSKGGASIGVTLTVYGTMPIAVNNLK